MSNRATVRLATRRSDLAVRQAGTVKRALEDRRFEVELVEMETTGDRVRDELIHRLGKTGAFVRALDEAVIDGEVDGAVHSMKDMPTEGDGELIVAGVPERGRHEDLLVTPDGASIDELPDGATVGTSSLRRQAQLLRHRPDLDVQPLRGNVDTRIQKLLAPSLQREHERRLEDDRETKGNAGDEDHERSYERSIEEWFDDLDELERQAMEREIDTEYDAVVLAAAGLERSGLLHHVPTEPLPADEFVPAPGQGALAVTMRDSETAKRVNDVLDHARTRVETTVERTILAELGGGCVAPLGVYALVQGEHVHVHVQVLDREGEEVIDRTRDLSIERYHDEARGFAADLADDGAAELIAEARREADETADGSREEGEQEGEREE